MIVTQTVRLASSLAATLNAANLVQVDHLQTSGGIGIGYEKVAVIRAAEQDRAKAIGVTAYIKSCTMYRLVPKSMILNDL